MPKDFAFNPPKDGDISGGRLPVPRDYQPLPPPDPRREQPYASHSDRIGWEGEKFYRKQRVEE